MDERFAGFAAEARVECGPLTDAQRNDKRAEIDALVAHAYGLTEDELRFIFTDFTENAVTPRLPGKGPGMVRAVVKGIAEMTSRQPRFTPLGSSYELVDNDVFGSHEQALEWLANTYVDPLNVATGYVSLEGLDALAKIVTGRVGGGRLLIGATPLSESLTGPVSETVAGRFEQSVNALGRQRDFSAFPAARRAVLERVTGFIEAGNVEVRRYARGFLHGKAYIFGDFDGRTTGYRRGPGFFGQPHLWRPGVQPRTGDGALPTQRGRDGLGLVPTPVG